MLGLYQLHYLAVNLGLSLGGAGQGGIAAQILVGHRFHGYHVKIFAHAVAGNHGPGQFGGLLDIVGSAGGSGFKDQFLRGTSAGQGGNLVFQFLLAHQVMVSFIHLHGIAQGAGGAGNDGDFLHRGGVGLKGGYQGMTDFVVGHNHFLLVG